MKRLLSFLLALAMCVGMLPAGVWADPAQDGQTSEPTTEITAPVESTQPTETEAPTEAPTVEATETTEPEVTEPEATEPVVQPEPDPEPITEPDPEPEKTAGFPVGNLLMVIAVVLVGGGAAYYFKVYRPKHEAAGLDEDDYDYDEADPYGDMETEEETEDEE